MFLLPDLCFLLCSLDLDVLCAQRIIGFFYLNYPQINEVGEYDHMIRRSAWSLYKTDIHD